MSNTNIFHPKHPVYLTQDKLVYPRQLERSLQVVRAAYRHVEIQYIACWTFKLTESCSLTCACFSYSPSRVSQQLKALLRADLRKNENDDIIIIIIIMMMTTMIFTRL